MGWENMRPVQEHQCRTPYLWFAKPGQRWRCTKRLEKLGQRVPCGRLYEVYSVQDGASSGLLAWREVQDDSTASTYASRPDEADVTREAVEHRLYSAHLGPDAEGKGTTQALAEMEIIRWTLDELERCGLAKWTHE